MTDHIVITLTVGDVHEATRILSNLLDVTFRSSRLRDMEAIIGGAMLRLEESYAFWDSESREKGDQDERRRKAELTLVVPDIRTAYAKAMAAGLTIIGDIRTNNGGRSGFFAYAYLDKGPDLHITFYDRVSSSLDDEALNQ